MASRSRRRSGEEFFATAFGFAEPTNYDDVRARFVVESTELGGRGQDQVTLVTHPATDEEGSRRRRFFVGVFDTPSVADLRSRIGTAPPPNGGSLGLTFAHLAGDAATLHRTHPNSVHQAASQFNCLEMVNPTITPDHGVTRYCNDHTQGPSCALSCLAATVYRNYFVGESQEGQGGTNGTQLDLMDEVGRYLGNNGVTNGNRGLGLNLLAVGGAVGAVTGYALAFTT